MAPESGAILDFVFYLQNRPPELGLSTSHRARLAPDGTAPPHGDRRRRPTPLSGTTWDNRVALVVLQPLADKTGDLDGRQILGNAQRVHPEVRRARPALETQHQAAGVSRRIKAKCPLIAHSHPTTPRPSI